MASYLLFRKGFYSLRLKVPADLTSIYPSWQILKSLRTQDILARPTAVTLSQIISQYIGDRKTSWTAKTALEYEQLLQAPWRCPPLR